jgi:hypothetical protein
MRRRLLALLIAGLLLMAGGWLNSLNLTRNAITDADNIRLLAQSTLQDIKDARDMRRMDRATHRAAAARMLVLLPMIDSLQATADEKQSRRFPFNIPAAARYDSQRAAVLRELSQLDNLREAGMSTRPITEESQ